MSVDLIPANEAGRLAAIRRYEILDTPPDGAFDRIAALAARFFDVPIATVTIVDEDRIWFKAAHGIEVTQIGRDPGLCASAILQDDPYVVTAADVDPRTLNNPLVRGELGLRFYAAAPIRTPDGYNLGTLNVIAPEPRDVAPGELQTLRDLAAVVADELELRLAARRTVQSERRERSLAQEVARTLQLRLLPRDLPEIPRAGVATYYRPASGGDIAGGDFIDVFSIDDEGWVLAVGDVCGKGPEAAAVMGEVRHALRAVAMFHREPSAILRSLNSLMLREGLDDRFCTMALLVLRPAGDGVRLRVCVAGHPAPLVRRADGRVEAVGPTGQLLGVVPHPRLDDGEVELAVGDLVVLYTDGAVEQRGVSILDGQRALVDALSAVGGADAPGVAAELARAVIDPHGAIDDDVALLVASVRPPARA